MEEQQQNNTPTPENNTINSKPLSRQRSRSPNFSSSKRKKFIKNVHTIRIAIPIPFTGGIIGRGGSNISEIRNETKCHLDLIDSKKRGVDKRILQIEGATTESCIKAATLVARRLCSISMEEKEKNNRIDNQSENEVEVMFLVTVNQVGAAIGKRGAVIKDIRSKTGAMIQIDTQCLYNTTEKDVIIGGNIESVCDAIEKLFSIALEHVGKDRRIFWEPGSVEGDYNRPPPRNMDQEYDRGEYMPYQDDSYYHPMESYDYRDYPDGEYYPEEENQYRRLPPSQYYERFDEDEYYDQPRRFKVRHPRDGSEPQFNERMFKWPQIPPPFTERKNEFGDGLQQMTTGGYMSTVDRIDAKNYVDDGEECKDVNLNILTIPYPVTRKQASAIIGIRGDNVNYIRKRSGAYIRIDKAKSGPSDSIASIKGSSSQVKYAITLINRLIQRG